MLEDVAKGSQKAKKAPRGSQDGPERHPEAPKKTPRGPQLRHKTVLSRLKTAPKSLQSPQEAPDTRKVRLQKIPNDSKRQ